MVGCRTSSRPLVAEVLWKPRPWDPRWVSTSFLTTLRRHQLLTTLLYCFTAEGAAAAPPPFVSPTPGVAKYALTGGFATADEEMWEEEEEEELEGKAWIPQYLVFHYSIELQGLQTRPMLGVTLTLPHGAVLKKKDLSVSVVGGTQLLVKIGYHQLFSNPKEIHKQRMLPFRGQVDDESARVCDNLANRRSAFVQAVNDLQTKYQTTALKAVFRLDLPCKVEEKIEYLKVHDVEGKHVDIDLVKVVDKYVDNTTAVGFAFSQGSEDTN
jgi:hypothetical protein